jgi:hypothetical protein
MVRFGAPGNRWARCEAYRLARPPGNSPKMQDPRPKRHARPERASDGPADQASDKRELPQSHYRWWAPALTITSSVRHTTRHRETAKRSWRPGRPHFLDCFAPSGARNDEIPVTHFLAVTAGPCSLENGASPLTPPGALDLGDDLDLDQLVRESQARRHQDRARDNRRSAVSLFSDFTATAKAASMSVT